MSLSKEEQQRYSRHLLLEEFGLEAQLKLKEAKVLVVGAGGLGCPCLQYLVAAGIGYIGIADEDVVSVSNLQRQILFSMEDVGKPKADVARTVLLQQNPLVKIKTHPYIREENVFDILSHYDLVVDGSDNFNTRYLLNDACVITKKPYIYGALFKFEGQVSSFNYKSGPTYRCLYPEPPAAGDVPACGEAGVIGVLPGIIGTYQAMEAIKIITGIGEVLSGKLMVFNLLTNNVDVLKFKAIPGNSNISELSDYDEFCGTADLESVDWTVLSSWIENDLAIVIDVREEHEFEAYNIGGINVPLDEVGEDLSVFQSSRKLVLVCQTGSRSKTAQNQLKQKHPDWKIFNLKGGIQATI